MIRRAILASIVMLALAACGTASHSLASLRSHAAGVCVRALAQDARIAPPPVPARTAAFLRRGIVVLRGELAGLRSVPVPSAQRGPYSVALGSLSRELEILTSTAHDLDRGADPLTAIKILQHRLAPVEADDHAAWRTLDVPACANR